MSLKIELELFPFSEHIVLCKKQKTFSVFPMSYRNMSESLGEEGMVVGIPA